MDMNTDTIPEAEKAANIVANRANIGTDDIYCRNDFAIVISQACEKYAASQVEKLQTKFLDSLLTKLESRGIDATNWNGDKEPAELIADGIEAAFRLAKVACIETAEAAIAENCKTISARDATIATLQKAAAEANEIRLRNHDLRAETLKWSERCKATEAEVAELKKRLSAQKLGDMTIEETRRADAAELALEQLRKEHYAAGVWLCPKCSFTQFKNILYVGNATVAADPTILDMACPNDGELMRRVTWKERCEDIAKACEGQIKRAVAAEDQLTLLQQDVRPLVFSLREMTNTFPELKESKKQLETFLAKHPEFKT